MNFLLTWLNFDIILLFFAISFLIASSGLILTWREKSNIIHSASHSSVLAISLSSVLLINFSFSALLSSLFLTVVLNLFLKAKLSRNEAISTSGIFIMVAGFAIEILQNGSQNLSRYLIGDIFLTSRFDAVLLFLVSFSLAVLYFINLKKIVIASIYKRNFWIFQSFWIKILEFFAIIYLSRSVGILCASFPLIFIPLIARKIAKNPRQMMILSFLMAILLLFFTYFVAIYFNCYFSLLMTLVLILFFMLIFLIY